MQLSIVLAILISGAATAAWLSLRSRKDPIDAERRRRALINDKGRLLEGVATDFVNGVVYYTYSWRGVEYEASQDLNTVPSGLPVSPDDVIGVVTVKFLADNPVNSIVYSESWSGLPRYGLSPPNTNVI
jgi:hypothetical protein